VNVTVPFKESVMRGLDRASDTAKAVSAVNTIYTDSAGKLIGENTDVSGFLDALRATGFRPRGKNALLIGAGGAARAVAYALLEAGAADVLVANRTIEKARDIVRDFARYRGHIRAAPLDTLDDAELLGRARLVVNSTSLGLHGSRFVDYDPRRTPAACVHFDLAYADKPTAFVAAAAKAGRPVVDGRAMLLYQGAAAFRLFTGRKAPVEVMARAIGIQP
jgi:shikimate dehydrogenase